MKLKIFLFIFLLSVFRITNANNDQLRVIHVFVALCDNENQGIVPVSQKLGNGQDPYNNLYWGAAYGVKTFFHKKSKNWKLIASYKHPSSDIIERVIFKNIGTNTYMIADAYDGARIRQATTDFLHASSGQFRKAVTINNRKIQFGGNSDLIVYVGHNGLMDFKINENFRTDKRKKRDVIILSCYGKRYFQNYMKQFNTNPLVWSTGLMSPEAYTLKWAIDGWLKNENNSQIINRAREAYNYYQKCGMKGASNLLKTGF